VLDGEVRDIAGADFTLFAARRLNQCFSGSFCVLNHPGGQGNWILYRLFGVFSANQRSGFGYGGSEARDDLILK
jgi:hypothetical protein